MDNEEKKKVKEKILNEMIQTLNHRITVSQKALEGLEASRNNETKSSAGDKYETGRAMMQMEIDKQVSHLAKAKNLKASLLNIDFSKIYDNCILGSIAISNKGKFILAVPLGKIKVENEEYFAISLEAPLAKAILNHQKGKKLHFQNSQLEIRDVY